MSLLKNNRLVNKASDDLVMWQKAKHVIVHYCDIIDRFGKPQGGVIEENKN